MRRITPPFSGTLCALALLLCACAGVQPVATGVDPELESRVQTYWELRTARQFEASYAYEVPEFRKKNSLTPYITELTGSILEKAEVNSITVDGDRAIAVLNVTYDVSNLFMTAGGERKRPVVDHWRRIDGTWFHLLFPPKDAEPVFPSAKDGESPKSSRRLSSGGALFSDPAEPETQEIER